jgi:rod shape-determining protein MreD
MSTAKSNLGGVKVAEVVLILSFGLILTVCSFLPTVVRTIGWVTPEWSLIIVLYLTQRAGLPLASLAAFLLGCIQDSLTIAPEGLESLALILIASIVAFSQSYVKLNNFFLSFLVALASLIKNTVFIPGILSLMDLFRGLSSVIIFDFIFKAIITGLISIPILYFLDRLSTKASETQS